MQVTEMTSNSFGVCTVGEKIIFKNLMLLISSLEKISVRKMTINK